MAHLTIQRIIEVDLDELRSPDYEKNIEVYGEHSDTCFICGKRTKENSKRRMVHYLENGNLVSYGGSDIEESQGFFYVGPDCAKKLVIQFTFPTF